MMLVDFFANNEDWQEQYRPTWRIGGVRYFFRQLSRAVSVGWEVIAEEIDYQRRRVG